MDFGSIVDSVKEKIRDLMETNKTLFFAAAGMAFVFLLCIVLLIYLLATGSGKKSKTKGIEQTTVMGTETPVIPDGPKLPKDYNISRPAKDKWTKEESEEWFTVPTEKEIESLSFSNDKIINDILEAAP